MAQGAFEGGVVSIRGDASQVKNELLEVSKLLTELEKNKVKLKPEIDINNVKKDVNKLEQYMQGKFGALDFSQVYSKLMTQVQKNPNKFAEELAKTMRGVNLLEQAVKPEDISKLAAASAQEMFDLVQRLGGLAEGTKPTSNLVTKRLKEIYDKYPNGIEGLSGSGKGGGFGASEEALNKIGDTLGRIDKNVQSISESILNGTNALRTASQGAEEFAGDIEKAEKATDKLTQKQQDLKNAIRNETVNTDWDWTLQYLNGADSKGKPSISKKTEKPKTTPQKPKEQKGDSQPEAPVHTPDVKPIKDAVVAEEKLQGAVEKTTNALKEQNNETSKISNTDMFSSNATVDTSENINQISQAQVELGSNVETTTELLENQQELLTSMGKENGISSETLEPLKTSFEDIIKYTGRTPQVKNYIYSLKEAETIIKQMSQALNKSDLNREQMNQLWGALTSVSQLSQIGSEEEFDQAMEIMEKYSELFNNYLKLEDVFPTTDQKGISEFGKQVSAKVTAWFDVYSQYQEALNQSNKLDSLRQIYTLDTQNKADILAPDDSIQGYSNALERIKIIITTMEEYKKLLDEAIAKGQDITEEDKKFLENYDKTKNQWIRANERAQNNLNQLQNQEKLKEEAKQRIKEQKQIEKERWKIKKKQQREERAVEIAEDQEFESSFQNFDVNNIENMGLEEIEQQLSQMEEYITKAQNLKSELNHLKELGSHNKTYKESEYDEEELALLSYTDEETQWLDRYQAQLSKRKEYLEKLKKRKVDINKEIKAKEEAETADIKSDEDAKQAQDNADQAQKAADKAQKAASESDKAMEKIQATEKQIDEKKDIPQESSAVTESANAKQTAQKKVKYVEETKATLESNLKELEQAYATLKERKEKIDNEQDKLKDVKKYKDDFFEMDAESAGKTVKQYRTDKIKENIESLKNIESLLEKKEAEINKIKEKIKYIDELEEQGFDVKVKGQTSKKKKGAKSKIIIPNKPQATSAVDGEIQAQTQEEKKDGQTAQELVDEMQNTNNKLQEAKELTDEQNQLLTAIFGEGGKDNSNNNNSLGNENNSFASLIESLKNLPAITEILSEFDAVNSNISKNAQGAADAIQAEANAFSSMTQATQGVNSKQLITSDKRDTGLLEIGSTGNELKEIEQKKDQYKKITDQIKIIEDGRIQAEEEIARYSTSDKNFKVGRSKNKAYDLIKMYAEQLKQDYEAYEKLDPNDTSDKAKEIIAKYENSRVAFSKAVSKMVANGLPKDKGDESVGFWELSNKHGVGSEGFDEAEKHVADNLKFLEERLNQQKQQAEIVLNKLYAERDRLQQELTSSSSQANVPANRNNPPADKPDLGGGQSANGIRTEGDEAGNAVANMQTLAQAKKEVTEANQKLSQSAQETTNSLNGEAGAGINTSEAFDPKPLQQEIDALKQVSEQQKKTIDEQKQAIDELQKKQEQATNEKIANLQKENEALTAQQRKELEQRRQAELNAQVMANLQKKQFEEDEKIRKEQEAKAAQKAEERAKKAEENARIKTEDKDFSKLYTEYGKDYSAILDAKSVQEFDMAVAHLTETERQFWEARMLQAGGSAYAHQADMLKQNDLPEGYEKSVDNQTAVLKQREMAIAEYTANVIAELEKQEAAFEKMDTVYKTATDNPNHARKDFIDSSLVDRNQTQKYTYAIDDVTKSLQRMHEIIQSMKDGTFDFGNVDALRELLELRQNLSNQMSTAKDADKAYKEAQGQIEAESVKKTEQYKTVLTDLGKQIEKIQTASKTLINPDSEYKTELESAKELLATIQTMIEELNTNPLQFMGKDGDKNAKVIQSTIDGFKEGIGQFQEDFQSQTDIQGRINTYFTSYKGAYTSFFREIKDSFKSQALGELQNEIDRTFKTFEDSITNLNRATGLNQGEFLDKYLNTNGGKATASQNEQQQKVKNAIAENYRGLITDMSNELSKVQDRMSNIFGENFLKGDFLANFRDNFTAGLGNADEFSKFQNNAQKAKDSFIELQKIQKQMADGKLDLTQLAPDQLKDKIQEIVKLFADLNENYKKVTDNAKDFTFADMGDIEKQRAGITQFLKSNRGISSEARAYLQDYFNQLQQGISQADLTKLTDGWHQVADAEQAADRTGATFMSELQTRFRSLSAYLLSFVSFYRVIGVFKDGINIIHELDDALTEMQKVSDESLASLREYQKTTFATANDIGTTAAQLQQSTADWMRLGEDLQQASQSAQTANVLFNVSEFESIDEATTALVAMSAAYADAEKDIDKMDIVDRLNLIGNNYAIATDELATALQDGAATLQTAGNDLDEAIALTTAGNEKIA